MSYGDVAGFDAYCEARGYDVTAEGPKRTAALVRASLFVDGLGYRDTGTGIRTPFWPGTPADANQENEWPREDAADIYGNEFASNVVPTRVIHATYEVAFFALGGGDINRAINLDQIVIREKFGEVEFQYADPVASGGSTDPRPVLPLVSDLLAPLITGGGGDAGNPYGITVLAG